MLYMSSGFGSEGPSVPSSESVQESNPDTVLLNAGEPVEMSSLIASDPLVGEISAAQKLQQQLYGIQQELKAAGLFTDLQDGENFFEITEGENGQQIVTITQEIDTRELSTEPNGNKPSPSQQAQVAIQKIFDITKPIKDNQTLKPKLIVSPMFLGNNNSEAFQNYTVYDMDYNIYRGPITGYGLAGFDNANVTIAQGATVGISLSLGQNSKVTLENGATVRHDVTATGNSQVILENGATVSGSVDARYNSKVTLENGATVRHDVTANNNSHVTISEGAKVGGLKVLDKSRVEIPESIKSKTSFINLSSFFPLKANASITIHHGNGEKTVYEVTKDIEDSNYNNREFKLSDLRPEDPFFSHLSITRTNQNGETIASGQEAHERLFPKSTTQAAGSEDDETIAPTDLAETTKAEVNESIKGAPSIEVHPINEQPPQADTTREEIPPSVDYPTFDDIKRLFSVNTQWNEEARNTIATRLYQAIQRYPITQSTPASIANEISDIFKGGSEDGRWYFYGIAFDEVAKIIPTLWFEQDWEKVGTAQGGALKLRQETLQNEDVFSSLTSFITRSNSKVKKESYETIIKRVIQHGFSFDSIESNQELQSTISKTLAKQDNFMRVKQEQVKELTNEILGDLQSLGAWFTFMAREANGTNIEFEADDPKFIWSEHNLQLQPLNKPLLLLGRSENTYSLPLCPAGRRVVDLYRDSCRSVLPTERLGKNVVSKGPARVIDVQAQRVYLHPRLDDEIAREDRTSDLSAVQFPKDNTGKVRGMMGFPNGEETDYVFIDSPDPFVQARHALENMSSQVTPQSDQDRSIVSASLDMAKYLGSVAKAADPRNLLPLMTNSKMRKKLIQVMRGEYKVPPFQFMLNKDCGDFFPIIDFLIADAITRRPNLLVENRFNLLLFSNDAEATFVKSKYPHLTGALLAQRENATTVQGRRLENYPNKEIQLDLNAAVNLFSNDINRGGDQEGVQRFIWDFGLLQTLIAGALEDEWGLLNFDNIVEVEPQNISEFALDFEKDLLGKLPETSSSKRAEFVRKLLRFLQDGKISNSDIPIILLKTDLWLRVKQKKAQDQHGTGKATKFSIGHTYLKDLVHQFMGEIGKNPQLYDDQTIRQITLAGIHILSKQ